MMPVQQGQPALAQQPAGYQPQTQPMYAPAQGQTQPQAMQPLPIPSQGMMSATLPPRTQMAQPVQLQPAPLATPMENVAPTALPLESNKDMLDQLIEKELSPTTAAAVHSAKPATSHQGQKTKVVIGPYKIQVATVDSKENAIKEVKRIRNIDTRLFSDKKIFAQEINSMGTKKPSYRVIIDGFPTPNAAAQFSNKLKIHKVKGIVLHQPN
jgi:hypothetical protein